ncbi:response regulator [Paenibacillus pasadenensis]|uniref:response regulator n=1 Tax=Paenibacillus pasadenensis TaxID=217090 RepID=UPI0020404379|nr:response regulator [Paenibacillus pasadenensis]MCM3746597.1 response regulator [Paenibacillus pasadenensis]
MFHVLIVDDYPDQVESLVSTIPFEELGIGEVYQAYSGMEALEIVKSCTVDIVITDIRMPGMSGLELLRRIREGSSKTKCIFISGHADFEYAKQAIELQSSHYLLKPVETEALIATLKNVVSDLHEEWKEVASYQRAVYTLREHFSLLSGELLNHLLQDRRYPKGVIAGRMNMLELPFHIGDRTGMFIMRLEDGFHEFDDYDLSLMEFAVANIAGEIFGEPFHLWHCKDSYDNLVFLLKAKKTAEDGEDDWRQIEKLAANLHRSVSVYLKRNVSIAVAEQFEAFPERLSRMHRICLSAMRRQIGDESNFFVTARDEPEQSIEGGLRTPYQPPLLIHLLETGSWEKAARKLDDIFAELAEKWAESPEYAQEVWFSVMSSFHYVAHKNGKQLGQIMGGGHHAMMDAGNTAPAYKQLKDKVYFAFSRLTEDADRNTKDSRKYMIKKIHQFIDADISRDLSLQAIADQVKLHPAYISKMYKTETGMNVGDYVLKKRMGLAAKLLQDSSDKIYEIAQSTGYLTTHYFSKVFKSYYGMTPLEFREKSADRGG